MARIVLTGSETGFQKIAMNHLLQEHVGYRLSKAKAVVDAILDETPVTLEFYTAASAETFLSEAQQLGAIGRRE